MRIRLNFFLGGVLILCGPAFAGSPDVRAFAQVERQSSLPAIDGALSSQAPMPPNSGPVQVTRAEGIGLSHSGDPFDLPNFTIEGVAQMLRAAGGTHYRPHVPLKEAHPVLSLDDLRQLDLAAKDPAVMDSMIDALSRGGHWERIDALVQAFQSQGIKLVLVIGAGYRKEAPLFTAADGTQTPVSPSRIGRIRYLTLVQWLTGATVRRYASRVQYWQAENEINLADIVTAVGWRVEDEAWADVNYRKALVGMIAHTVHAEGKRQGLELMTLHNFAAGVPWTNFMAGATHLAGAIRTYALDAELDIVGVDLYYNRFFPRPMLIDRAVDDVETAVREASGRPVWVLETGFPDGPSEIGFSDARQAAYFGSIFDACYAAGARVVLAFGWFWNPHGWYTDNPNPLPWYDPMAAEQYWSPIHVAAGPDGRKTVSYGGAWASFQDAARRWGLAPLP